MRLMRILALVLLALLPVGCTGGVVETLSIAATMATGHQYDMTNRATKSYSAPYVYVFRATRAALHELEIRVNSYDRTTDGDIIRAHTGKYALSVELISVTPQVTRISVVAGDNVLQRDKATAVAVVEQVERVLERNHVAAYNEPLPDHASLD